MDISSNRSQDEDRVMQRQLYRAGQTTPAAKTPASTQFKSAPGSTGAPARSMPAKKNTASNSNLTPENRILLMFLLLGVGYFLLCGTPSQRRKTLIGLGVAGWLLMLGGISYCLFLPDFQEINRQRRAIFEDPNLTMEEKFQKSRELDAKLTPGQRRQLAKMNNKERIAKNNSDIASFLKMTPEERVAQLKKEAEEWAKRREEMRKMFANRNKGGGPGGKGGGPGGRGGGPGGGGGPPGGFGGGGGGGPEADISRLDNGSSPEARSGNLYKGALRSQMGIGGGGRGGGGGGGGGGKR